MRKALPLVTLLAVLAVAIWPGTMAAAQSLTVKLGPQNNSGESGTATLTADGAKTKVVVNVTGQPAGVAQPMHVHKGTCAQLDPKPTHMLPNLSGGKAEATLDVALKDLQKDKFAINGHKSAQEASVYVFCGEIPAQ